MAAEVVLYTTAYCYYCVRARALLTRRRIAYREVDVTDDEALHDWLVEATGGRRKLPQVFIGGAPIGGFRELAELDRTGALGPLVDGATPPRAPTE